MRQLEVSPSIALLQATVLTGAAAIAAARAWLAAVDLECLPSEQFPLLPLAMEAIEQADPDAPWLPRLRGVYRRAWYANQLLLEATARLTRALTSANIPVLLVDAVPLSLSVYTDRLRPIHALDLIVPYDRAQEAARILGAQGWQDLAGAAPYAAGPWDIVRRFRMSGGQHANLHRRVAAFWPSHAMDAAAWERTQPLSANGHTVLMLSTADQLVRCCRTAATPNPTALVALADVARLLTHGQVDWDAVLEVAAVGHVGRTLRHVCQQVEALLGIRAPEAVLTRLRMLPLSPFERYERRCSLPSLGKPGRVQAAAMVYTFYRRAVAAQGLPPRLGDFLAMMQRRWGCASRRALLQQAIRRLLCRH